MARIIAFPGSALPSVSRVEAKPDEEKAVSGDSPANSQEDRRVAGIQALEMHLFLDGFPPSRSETLRLRRTSLLESTDEELLSALSISHRGLWKEHPAYYRVLGEILVERKLLGGPGLGIMALFDGFKDDFFRKGE